jgi:hypothetical protein
MPGPFLNYISLSIAAALWALFWGRFVLELYQADLKNILTFSEKVRLPFTNFDGFVAQLRLVLFGKKIFLIQPYEIFTPLFFADQEIIATLPRKSVYIQYAR